MIKIKKGSNNLPPQEIYPCNTSDRSPCGNSQGIGSVNCYRKNFHPRGCRDPRSTSFLCKCNLT